MDSRPLRAREGLAGEPGAGAVVGDGQRVAVRAVAEAELALEVGTPQRIGGQGLAERRAPGLVALALALGHQAMAVQHHVDGADRGRLDHRQPPGQLVADLGCAPTGIVPLDADNGLLDLEGQFVRVTVRTPGPVFQSADSERLVAVEDLVAGLARDAELPAYPRHLLAIEKPGYKTKTFIHRSTLFPGHRKFPPNASLCNLCARNIL